MTGRRSMIARSPARPPRARWRNCASVRPARSSPRPRRHAPLDRAVGRTGPALPNQVRHGGDMAVSMVRSSQRLVEIASGVGQQPGAGLARSEASSTFASDVVGDVDSELRSPAASAVPTTSSSPGKTRPHDRASGTSVCGRPVRRVQGGRSTGSIRWPLVEHLEASRAKRPIRGQEVVERRPPGGANSRGVSNNRRSDPGR
jgi:hypothetical protein